MSENKIEIGIIRILKSRLIDCLREREALAIRLAEKEKELRIIRISLKAARLAELGENETENDS